MRGQEKRLQERIASRGEETRGGTREEEKKRREKRGGKRRLNKIAEKLERKDDDQEIEDTRKETKELTGDLMVKITEFRGESKKTQ